MVSLPDLKHRGFAADLARGFALPFQSVRTVLGEGPLRSLAALSALITFVVLAGLVVLVTQWSPIEGFRPEGTAWYHTLARFFFAVLQFLVGAAIFVVGAVTLPLLATVPFQDLISERTERLCGVALPGGAPLGPTSVGPDGDGGAKFVRQTAASFAHTLGRVGVLYGGHLLLLVLWLVPGIGHAAWTALSALWTIYWLAGEYLDIPMTRHLYRFAEVRAALRARRALCLAFGAGLGVLLFVPVLNCFVVPAAVVAGTVLFRALVEAGHVRPLAAGAVG